MAEIFAFISILLSYSFQNLVIFGLVAILNILTSFFSQLGQSIFRQIFFTFDYICLWLLLIVLYTLFFKASKFYDKLFLKDEKI
jgi:hypothetical protein